MEKAHRRVDGVGRIKEKFTEGGQHLMYLSDEEIRSITHPLSQPAAMVRWFMRNGFVVKIRPNGMPLISRAHYETVMSEQAIEADKSKSGLNVAALKKAVRYGDDGQKTQKQPARVA